MNRLVAVSMEDGGIIRHMPTFSDLTFWRTLIGIVLTLAVVVALVRALTCEAGWQAWVCYQLARFEARFFLGWRCENPCPFPEHGPALIVANHTSPVDPVILWIRHFAEFQKPRLRVIGWMTAAEYCDIPGLVGWVCRAMESIPVSRSGRDMASVRAALRRLQDGKLTGVFPEGRLNDETPDSLMLSANTGVAWLALKSRVPVIPVFIHNAPRARTMIRCFLARRQTTVVYGKPLDLSAWPDRRPSRETLVEVTNHIMASIAELGGIEYTPISAEPAAPEDSDAASRTSESETVT